MNNPEYITKYDIVDSGFVDIEGSNPPRLKIFEQTARGTNTYYQTHISWHNAPYNESHKVDYPNDNGFFLDVDFYNPSATEEVDIFIRNLASSKDYAYMQNYFRGGENFKITLSPGEHKRLLRNDQYVDPLHVIPLHEGWNQGMAILFDFEISGNNEVVVSSLAAYEEANLVMKNAVIKNGIMIEDTKNTLHDGRVLNNGDMIHAAKPYNDPAKRRPGEDDLFEKYKGTAKNQAAWIKADMEYVIDDNTVKGQPLQVNLSDSYYTDKGITVANPKDIWMTHTNPTSDAYGAFLRAMPDTLHEFTYPYGNGQYWNFDFKHRNIKFENLDINGDPNDSVNKPVPKNIMEQMELDVAKGTKSLYYLINNTQPEYDDEGNLLDPPDKEALGMAAWGTTYHYTIKVSNVGHDSKTIAFRIKNSENVIFGLKDQGWDGYYTVLHRKLGGSDNDWVEHSVTVYGNTTKTFEIITLSCGGNAGLNNQLIVC